MSCPDRDVLSAYFDGESIAPEIAAHAAACAACRSFLADLAAIREAVVAERPPLRAAVGLDDVLRRAAGVPWWRRRVAVPAPIIALLLLALLVIPALLFRRAHAPSSGAFHDFDSGGRAVIYVRPQGSN